MWVNFQSNIITKINIVVVLVSIVATVNSIDPRTKDPNYHLATDNHMTIKKEDGSIVFGSDSGDSYRVESRSKDGEVRGVYGYISPDGSSNTIAYSAGKRGYKIEQLENAMPNGLAPFPKNLKGEVDKESRPSIVQSDYESAKVTQT